MTVLAVVLSVLLAAVEAPGWLVVGVLGLAGACLVVWLVKALR